MRVTLRLPKKRYQPQAIALSLELPGVDGQTVLERLKTENHSPPAWPSHKWPV